METLKNLNKFWRTSALLPATTTPAGTYSDAAAGEEDDEVDVELVEEAEEEEEEEEEESFFELELVMRNCCRNETTTTNESSRLSSKVVPIEPDLKTHSPISILKSAPKFKVSLFRKPKTELLASSTRPDPDPNTKLDDQNSATRTISTLIRENSSSGLKPEEATLPVDSSKRFSKDVMQKYLKLKLIKPFHIHVARRSSKSRLFDLRDSNSTSSPASSPACEKLKPSSYSANGFRVVCKQLGKSRSASSMNVVSVSCGSRRDESLLEHDDGIQSAILHCKRSFNSSRESSMHSRSSSDSTEQEKQPHSEHHHHLT